MVTTTNENSAFGVVTFVSMTSDILQLTITRLDTGLTISGSNQDGSQKQGIISEQIFFTQQDVGLTIPIEITNIIYD